MSNNNKIQRVGGRSMMGKEKAQLIEGVAPPNYNFWF